MTVFYKENDPKGVLANRKRLMTNRQFFKKEVERVSQYAHLYDAHTTTRNDGPAQSPSCYL